MLTPADSAELHRTHFERLLDNPARRAHTETWLRDGTVDAWRHGRLYRLLDPLLAAHPGATWATVGDGRYGTDAHYLQSRGARAHATDVTDVLLAEAQARGFIEEHSAENAEHLSFADESFDFLLCKESLHHFPRPMLGFYEMLRCAREAVILIEPLDRPLRPPLSAMIWEVVRRLLAITLGSHGASLGAHLPPPEPLRWSQAYEAINYVYRLAERDVDRAALALGLPAVAYRTMNDFYEPGSETAPAEEGDALFAKVRREIAQRDHLCRGGMATPEILAAIVWKKPPSAALRAALESEGWDVQSLGQNPNRTATTPAGESARPARGVPGG